MAGVTFAKKWNRVVVKKTAGKALGMKSAQDVVRQLKAKNPSEEDYRERSLAIHGLICARCGREFDESNRHLLTVHHKDGNHHNNPPDGSNWENLCVYCHEDVHSREILGDYFDGNAGKDEGAVFYSDPAAENSSGVLAEKLKAALEKKKG